MPVDNFDFTLNFCYIGTAKEKMSFVPKERVLGLGPALLVFTIFYISIFY